MERLKKSLRNIKVQENISRHKSGETYILFLKVSAIEVAEKVKKTSTPTVREVTDELQWATHTCTHTHTPIVREVTDELKRSTCMHVCVHAHDESQFLAHAFFSSNSVT